MKHWFINSQQCLKPYKTAGINSEKLCELYTIWYFFSCQFARNKLARGHANVALRRSLEKASVQFHFVSTLHYSHDCSVKMSEYDFGTIFWRVYDARTWNDILKRFEVPIRESKNVIFPDRDWYFNNQHTITHCL